jgi:hypothetical protein
LARGVLSTYGRAGDYVRIYEINPLVEQIAQTQFTFFPHCAADKKILMGDARLTMERQESQQFDLLAVDAFSSDAIPIHLLTREALRVYFRHLKPNGILALAHLQSLPESGTGMRARGAGLRQEGHGRRRFRGGGHLSFVIHLGAADLGAGLVQDQGVSRY